jgi:aryl-alcohol dehydrogenase-like predicted oxidoreductase
MKTIILGRSGLQVSRLAFGTWLMASASAVAGPSQESV